RAEVRPSRRTTLHQRQHPSRHGAEQDFEGARREVPVDGRLRCALRRRLRLSRAADRAEGRSRARSEETRDADRFIGTMTEQFQRLGVLGTWDNPYLTMDFRYQAAIARTFGRFVEKGLVYKG